ASASDCLVCEIYDDDSAVFEAASLARRCTPGSIAACSIHGATHPLLQYFPEGILWTEHSEYFSLDERRAGIRGAQLVDSGLPRALSIKFEGARRSGSCKVSLLRID